MNYIVGDIGNTSTRICLLNKKFQILKSIFFETKKLSKKNFFKKKAKNFLYDIVNNKPEQEKFLFGWFKRALSV